MKSEPEEYSFARLKKEGSTWWDGVRNYQARNFMTTSMSPGDLVLFYHSNAEPPGVAGLAKIKSKARPDALQFDAKSDYFDPKSKKDNPTWHSVEVAFQKDFDCFVPLDEIKKNLKLKDMLVIQRGQRLSIQPVSPQDFAEILKMGKVT
jgi:predicted RNA-binding protein with PUA-like domain